MQVRCIRNFGSHEPGDLAEVPDGASVSPLYFEPVTPDPEPAPATPPPVSFPAAPKEM